MKDSKTIYTHCDTCEELSSDVCKYCFQCPFCGCVCDETYLTDAGELNLSDIALEEEDGSERSSDRDRGGDGEVSQR